MDKQPGQECPNCHTNSLNVYFEEEADQELGQVCGFCGFKGMTVNGKLLVLA